MRTYETGFEAAHIINGHPKCGRKHGHSYKLQIAITGQTEEWLDFSDIKEKIEYYIEKQLDHYDLGNITAEEIACKFGEYLTGLGWAGNLHLNETAKFGVSVEFGDSILLAKLEKSIQYASYKVPPAATIVK
jgi:6-pyruvoyl tetrahydropterin synthase/QueD family protein